MLKSNEEVKVSYRQASAPPARPTNVATLEISTKDLTKKAEIQEFVKPSVLLPLIMLSDLKNAYSFTNFKVCVRPSLFLILKK